MNKFKRYLKRKKITQKELAKILGYTEKHISEILNGKAQVSIPFAIKVERVLGYKALDLIREYLEGLDE